ncbi:MAG: GTP 3',8-cyclase MoaA [Planctomycetes bacterium]|nr:GTP 3',8-cyclase MoaA [Planctomycetota bacterium]
MIDGCGREIDHLRLSLTDHCNLACRYCVPEGPQPAPRMINAAFAFDVVKWMSEKHGIRHLRLTGGEPLLYTKLQPLVKRLATIRSLHEITLTTNGQALAQRAALLHRAGLTRINISLDSLNPDRFAQVTRGGRIDKTLAGIEAAVLAGLTPVKINVVVQRGLNDDELGAIAEWGMARGCVVRFLEVMPIGPLAHVVDRHLVPATEILERLRGTFDLRPIPQSLGQPAVDYAADGRGMRGVIGIIAPTTRPFCDRCRRIRVTSSGVLVACLHEPERFSLADCWRGQSLDESLADQLLHQAIRNKPQVGSRSQSLTMLSLGG